MRTTSGIVRFASGGADGITTGGLMSDRNPDPDDWNRGYTVGTGRSPVMFWLGMAFVVLVLGAAAWSCFAG